MCIRDRYTTDFTVCVSDFDEDAVTADTPARLVEQLARGKCLAVAKEHPGAVVLGCDTVVDVNGEVFGLSLIHISFSKKAPVP